MIIYPRTQGLQQHLSLKLKHSPLAVCTDGSCVMQTLFLFCIIYDYYCPNGKKNTLITVGGVEDGQINLGDITVICGCTSAVSHCPLVD